MTEENGRQIWLSQTGEGERRRESDVEDQCDIKWAIWPLAENLQGEILSHDARTLVEQNKASFSAYARFPPPPQNPPPVPSSSSHCDVTAPLPLTTVRVHVSSSLRAQYFAESASTHPPLAHTTEQYSANRLS